MSLESGSEEVERGSLLEEQQEQEEREEKEQEEQQGEALDEDEEEDDGVADGEIDDAEGGPYSAQEVNDKVFEELVLPEGVIEEAARAWCMFLQSSESQASAGDALYSALFDAVPGMQSLFKTPRAVTGLRIVNSLNQIITGLRNPKALKVTVEALAFQHLDMDVTIPRVVLFRDAIAEILSVEVGNRFSKKAQQGWCTALNYVGGAFIHIRSKYADRLKVLARSWAQANDASHKQNVRMDSGIETEEGGSGDVQIAVGVGVGNKDYQNSGPQKKAKKGYGWGRAVGLKSNLIASAKLAGHVDGRSEGSDQQCFGEAGNNSVPRNFRDMFMFNAAVMGFTDCGWMQEILASFDAIVTNISNSYRLQEECDMLSLRIAKYKGAITVANYKSVMLSSLRSLVKDWGSLHETSWAWLWENVERMLLASLGKPAVQEAALSRCLGSLDSETTATVRRDIYRHFFAAAPAGQDHFKQSTTRLHFIADRVLAFSLDIYREPKRMIDDLSALGLRHVGYGIPPEMFSPFVTSCVKVIGAITQDDAATEAFSWSLTLISRILQRVITEGSTMVMQAINANSSKQLKKAVACAARGQRASWVLKVQVGTQSISPLMWAIESGSFDAAEAIIVDLLTIRADRDSYYYGMDALFERHPDIIKRLCTDAPVILPVLLDGLIWRSRTTHGGQRRVNYYIKHLLIDSEGSFARAIEWIVEFNNPKIACHPVVSWVSDMVWMKVALRSFLFQRAWFLLNLISFLFAQSVLHYMDCGPSADDDAEEEAYASRGLTTQASSPELDEAKPGCTHGYEIRLTVIILRSFIYICVMGEKLASHIQRMCRSIMEKDLVTIWKLKIPAYLSKWQEGVSLWLTLCLLTMLILEPALHCAEWNPSELFDEHCPEGEALFPYYKPISTMATLLYFWLLSDLAVLSTRVSSFVLVCCRVASEALLTLLAIAFFVLAFASAMSSLNHKDDLFAGIPVSTVSLFRISLGLFAPYHFDHALEYSSLFLALLVFNVITVIFLLNLLIAQLVCAYWATYEDMVGFARLNRGKVVVETMPNVPSARFDEFLSSLRLEERIEFGEGDVGLAGGVQIQELASLNITTVDSIRRFGGTTSPSAQWPADDKVSSDEVDGFERLEKHIDRTMKRLVSRSKKGGGAHGEGSSAGFGTTSMNSFDNSGSCQSGSWQEE